MNEYEISKLKKELQRKNQLLKEEREDRQFTEQSLIQVQAERDKYHGQLLIARQTIDNVDNIIAENVREMKAKIQQENSASLNQLQSLRDKLMEEKHFNEKLKEQNRNKDTVISELSSRLRELSLKHKDNSYLITTKDITEQAMITHNQFYKLTEKYNKLCEDMENIMAENKILRKLHGVPENFGFDLEQIKIAEKQELQDYKAQCRKLEAEIEELQAERTQLRYRLRQYNTLYSNKGERYKDLTQRQLEYLDTYALNLKEGRVDLPEIDKSQKQMEKEIIKLRAKVEVLQNRGQITMIPGRKQSNDQNSGDKISQQSMRKFQDQIRGTLEPFVEDIRQLSQTNLSSLINTLQGLQLQGTGDSVNNVQYIQSGNSFNPPIPLPIAHNDWSKIKEGYSYKYSSKIPVDLKDYENDIGYDQLKARYEIAALQLQNIESLKMLKEKQDQQNLLMKQLQDLKQKYKKCLEVQDKLFVQYFVEKEQEREKHKKTDIEKKRTQSERDQIRAQLQILRSAFNALSTKNQLEEKYKSFAERLAKSQSGLVKTQRMFQTVHKQQIYLKENYTKLEIRTAQKQFTLKQKVLSATGNEKQLTMLMNQVLQETRNSVSSDTHNILLSKMEVLNDKSAAFAFKQSQLRLKIARLQSVEREMNIKDQIIEYLREDKLDLMLEIEIIKHRLQIIDPNYKTSQDTFNRLVKFINQNNISTVNAFKKFDRDGSSNLSKDEFRSALAALGFKLSKDQFDLLFAQFDLDGSQSLTYKQFVRKLKRGGLNNRSKQEQAIYQFFKAIKQANMTIKKAFQIIDMDGSNQITITEMETAFRKIGIDCDSRHIQAIFRMCDNNMDGKISCSELQVLYTDIIRQTQIDQIQFKIQLDWKYKFVLMIEETSIQNKMSLQQTFKQLDEDNNSYLSMSQIESLLRKSGVNIERKYMNELFRFLDSKYDHKVEYSQFLTKLEQAKKQKKRVERLEAVKKRAEQLKKQNGSENIQRSSQMQKNVASVELNVRLQALQSKQENLVKKNQKICKNIAEKQQKIKELQKQVEQVQRSYEKAQGQYHSVLQQSAMQQERLKNSLGEVEANTMKENIARLKITNSDIVLQLDTYKGLSDGLHDKNKNDLLSIEKLRAELNKHYQIVKQLQSQHIDKAKLGSLAIQIQYSKRNQQITNKKYDDLIEKIGKIEKENVTLSSEVSERQNQIVKTHLAMMQKSNLLQKKIDTLTSKILPTVSLSKIDVFVTKLRAISNAKSQLEEQNKALKQKNFSLQLRNDYVENEKVHLDQLERRLRRNYTDDSSIAIIDLTKKLSEYKMSELKAKREQNLLRQKEEYYTRINNANTENIKELQEELGKWEIKFNQRQEFWRKRMADQMKLLEDIQREATKVRQSEKKAAEYFNAKAEQSIKNDEYIDEMEPERRTQLRSMVGSAGGDNSETVNNLREQMRQLTMNLQEKQRQIYKYRTALQQLVPQEKLRLSSFGSQIGGYPATNSFVMQTDLTSSQLKNNARRFMSSQKDQETFYRQQAQRMVQAAQQSIDTLQRIIDQKNSQIKKRDRTIDDLKKTMLKRQEEDCYQIQKLNQQIRELRSKKEMANLNQIMNKPTNKNFYPSSSNNDDKVKSLMEMVEEKQIDIKRWENKYNQLYINKSKVKPTGSDASKKIIEEQMRRLQQEREHQKRRYTDGEKKLQEKIKNLEKLSKQKDTKLTQLHKAFMDVKQDIMKEKSSLRQQGNISNDQFINNMNRGNNPNDARLETSLQEAIRTIQGQNKKMKDYESEIKKLREQNRLNRTMSRR